MSDTPASGVEEETDCGPGKTPETGAEGPACPPAAQVGLGWVGRGAREPPTRGPKVAILGRPQAFVEQSLQARFPGQRTKKTQKAPLLGATQGGAGGHR